MLCVRMRGRRSIQRHHQITRARAIKRQVAAARGVTTLHIGDLSSFLRLRVRGGPSIAPSAAVLDWEPASGHPGYGPCAPHRSPDQAGRK